MGDIKSEIIRFLNENKPFHHGNSDPNEIAEAVADWHLLLIDKANSMEDD